MMTIDVIPGLEINILLLVFIGLAAGVLSGFAGIGGGFILTPTLIIFGFPAHYAVGTSLSWVVGNSLVAMLRHRKLGNVDMKLGLAMMLATIGGVEVGVRIVNWAKDIGLAGVVVMSISVCMLLVVGIYTLWESITIKRQLDRMRENGEELPADIRATSLSQRLQSIDAPPMLHFDKAGVTISLWVILPIGFFIGVMAGAIGVGGGFIMVPALVYLIGLPSFMAVGTGLFQNIFSAAYGSIRHTMDGNVIIFASFIILLASSIGVQFGAIVIRYARGLAVRFILSVSILLFAMGAILKLADILLETRGDWLNAGSVAVTFGGLGLTMTMVLALFIIGLRYQRGQSIPASLESFVVKRG